jgi:hypothetical protein
MGPEGLEPSPNRLRAGRSAARTSIPIRSASRPRRSRTFVARLSAECSSVELQAARLFLAVGPEGFEPPPPGLKGRCAAVTPQPRAPLARGMRLNRLRISMTPTSSIRRLTNVTESGRPDLNRRSPVPQTGGVPGFPTPWFDCLNIPSRQQPARESNPPPRLEGAVSSNR